MARRKKNDESDNLDNINNESDDNFGLPEVEYEPLKREEEKAAEPEAEPVEEIPVVEEYVEATETTIIEEVVEEEHVYSPNANGYGEEEESSIWPKILAIALLVIVAGGAIWYFGFYRPKQVAEERAKQEELERQEIARQREANRLADLKRQEDEKRRADSLAAVQKPALGTVEKLDGRTGLYYVVVASSIDGDLIMDYANKLVAKGVGCKIIPPFGKTKFSRLAIDFKDNYAEAQTTADGMKGGDYGNEIWVVKY